MITRTKLALFIGIAALGMAAPAFAQASDPGTSGRHRSVVAPHSGRAVVRAHQHYAAPRTGLYDAIPRSQVDSDIPYYGNAPYDQRDDW